MKRDQVRTFFMFEFIICLFCDSWKKEDPVTKTFKQKKNDYTKIMNINIKVKNKLKFQR